MGKESESKVKPRQVVIRPPTKNHATNRSTTLEDAKDLKDQTPPCKTLIFLFVLRLFCFVEGRGTGEAGRDTEEGDGRMWMWVLSCPPPPPSPLSFLSFSLYVSKGSHAAKSTTPLQTSSSDELEEDSCVSGSTITFLQCYINT